jgi:hypothetical protein
MRSNKPKEIERGTASVKGKTAAELIKREACFLLCRQRGQTEQGRRSPGTGAFLRPPSLVHNLEPLQEMQHNVRRRSHLKFHEYLDHLHQTARLPLCSLARLSRQVKGKDICIRAWNCGGHPPCPSDLPRCYANRLYISSSSRRKRNSWLPSKRTPNRKRSRPILLFHPYFFSRAVI